MNKTNKRIEIVCSTRASLSSMGKASRTTVQTVLSKHYTDVRISIVNTMADLEDVIARNPDLVVLGMKFIPQNPDLGHEDPDKIWVSDVLDNNDIAYTGSSQVAHQLELNKALAKQRILQSGLNTSPFYFASQAQPLLREDIVLTYPVFIKPADRGGGLGIDNNSVAYTFDQLQTKVQSIADQYHSDSIIEEYLPGREFSVAILRHGGVADFAVMPLELVADINESGLRLLSEDTKSANAEVVIPITDPLLRANICKFALDVFTALGARDYGRIDIRLDADGAPNFLEANLIPSLIAGYGSFPKACVMNADLSYEPMLVHIVELALQRNLLDEAEPVKQPSRHVTPLRVLSPLNVSN